MTTQLNAPTEPEITAMTQEQWNAQPVVDNTVKHQSLLKRFIQVFAEALTGPTCCDEFSCRQGRECPVRTGEYKPSEAMHHIQEKDQ